MSIDGVTVVNVIGEFVHTLIVARYGVPAHIRSDNGSEFITREMQKWLEKADVETLYIEPGAPWENGYAESFNSRLRDEFLEMNYFHNLNEAKQLATAWKEYYSQGRPLTSLGNRTPRKLADLRSDQACSLVRD